MNWVFSQILWLIGVSLLLVLVAAVLAPFESLGWWAGWSGKRAKKKNVQSTLSSNPDSEKAVYLLYLSGIGQATSDSMGLDEQDFIAELHRLIPEAEIITDVFPYSVSNNPLTGERPLRGLWRWVHSRQMRNPNDLLGLLLVNVRNVLQMAVSADPRYGPIYSIGVAEEITRSLAKHNYPLGMGKPLFLIGYSGGGQVSVGAAPFLASLIGAPVYLLSIGGFLTDDPGVEQIGHLYHCFGTQDPLQAMARYLYRGRWKVFPQSAWNRSVSHGQVSFRALGPMAHNGPGGYFDKNAYLPDGTSYLQATAAALRDAVLEVQLWLQK